MVTLTVCVLKDANSKIQTWSFLICRSSCGAPFCGAAVRPNMLNMPKSASEQSHCWFSAITAQVSSDGGNVEWQGPRNPHIETHGRYRRSRLYRHHLHLAHRCAGHHHGYGRMRGGWHSRFGRGRHYVSRNWIFYLPT